MVVSHWVDIIYRHVRFANSVGSDLSNLVSVVLAVEKVRGRIAILLQ
jgi:hypothetical protein